MATPTVDFSKYTTQPEAGSSTIDFSKYAGSHEPSAVPDISMPPLPPDDSGWLIGNRWAQEHPVTTSIAKSFDIANVGKNVYEGGKGVVKGAYELGKTLVTHPTTAYEKFVGAPAALQAQKATELWQQGGVGNRVQAAGHELAGALPVIGPFAASLGEQAGTGDIGGAVGQATGAMLASKIPELPRMAGEALPSLTRAGGDIGTLRQTLDPAPVTGRLPSYIKASDLVDKWDRTAASVPPELRAYVERVKAAGTGQSSLTFQNLWEAREALNDLKYDKNLTPKRAAMIGDIAKQLGDEVQGIANREGVGKQWRAAQSEYARGKSIERFGQNIGEPLGAAAGLKYGSALGEPFAAAYVGGQLGRMVAKPVIGGMVSSVLRRNTGPPTPPSTMPPLPPLYPISHEEYMRQMLRAKNGEISTTRLNQLTRNSPKLRRIPQPPEEEQ